MSLRLRLLNRFLRIFVKRRLARMRDPQKARRDLERAARLLFRAPPLSLILPIKTTGELPALWISNRPSRLAKRRPVILYVHGGGFVAGSPQAHAKMLARLSRLSAMEVFAPTYRLAPEHPFPAAVNDVNEAYNHLISKGYDPDDIILGGDSAGGTLALGLLARLCQEGRPPRGLFAFSPLTDFRFESRSFDENARRDPLLPSSGKERLRDMYLNGHSPQDPRVSPILATFPAPPPVFLQLSSSEILKDESFNMAERLRDFGGAVSIDEWSDAPHVWVLFDGLLPEAREALRRVADFLRAL